MIISDHILTEKLNRLIDENIDNSSLSIDTICQLLGVSRSQLHRIIKEQTQLSVSLYVRKYRLLKAKDLLVSTDLRISQISDAVGINNPQNFSTYFTEEFRISPTEFRKLQSQSGGAAPTPLPAADWNPPVPDVTRNGGTPPVPGNSSRHPTQVRSWRRRISTNLALLLVIGAGVFGWFQTHSVTRPAVLVGNSLAVLPFTNLGVVEGSPACEGIMDDIHRAISHVKNLRVISRSSSDQYKNTQKSIRQIGGELQVVNLLKGSVLKINDQIQVKVEILDTQDDSQRWVKQYSAPYKDIFTLTDLIVRDVASQLKLPISPSAAGQFPLARTQNLEAYNAFLQARQLLVTRTKANMLESISRFDRALAMDSIFAEAHACKAEVYTVLANLGYADAKDAQQRAEQSALTAIRLDPVNSTAYGVLGCIYHETYQWQAAENAYRIALQHNPNDAQVNYWYSLVLRSLGRLDEAMRYSKQAVALDPLYPVILGGHIVNCAYANRFDLAQASIENGRGLFDGSFIYHTAQGYYAMCQKDYDRAVAHIQKGLSLNPDYKRPTAMLLYCEAKRGNRPKASSFLHQLHETTPRANYERAVIYAGLGEADSCLMYLKKAADEGYIYRDMKVFPVFQPYWTHSDFQAILRQYKLPDEKKTPLMQQYTKSATID